MDHIDLFSGIGGFALAASWAGFETTIFCEKDKFCQKILHKHWPDVPIIEDIYEFDGKQCSGATILTAGFPCQPFSCAGKQRGKEDDRYLWPETLRVIGEAKPTWVVLENVRGLLAIEQGMVFHNLLLEMEAIGYETRGFLIPACGINAPHRRERLWIVAHTSGIGRGGRSDEDDSRQDRPLQIEGSRPGMQQGVLADTRHEGVLQHASFNSNEKTRNQQRRVGQDVLQEEQKTQRKTMADSDNTGSQGYRQSEQCSSEQSFGTGRPSQPTIPNWDSESCVGKLADGIPDRVARLRGLGNAIVPQVAYQILKGIKEIEDIQ